MTSFSHGFIFSFILLNVLRASCQGNAITQVNVTVSPTLFTSSAHISKLKITSCTVLWWQCFLTSYNMHKAWNFSFVSDCNQALGVNSGTIQDFQLTSSAMTQDTSAHHPPWLARADAVTNGEEMTPFKFPALGTHWLQVSGQLWLPLCRHFLFSKLTRNVTIARMYV